MPKISYKPVVNSQENVSYDEILEHGLHNRMMELLDGDITIDEVVSKLLLEKYDISEVMKVFNYLIEKNVIIESPESDLGVFSDEELEAFQQHQTYNQNCHLFEKEDVHQKDY